MKCKLLYLAVALLLIGAPLRAQKPKNTTKKAASPISNADKMGYARTNKYWGPGTYYCYAPGKPNNPLANTPISAMRDLIGISEADLYKEIAKQGFIEIPRKESTKAWFNETRNKEIKYFYSADKSYIFEPNTKDMYLSPVVADGKYAYSSDAAVKFVLIPKQDSLKVIDAIWQYLRDLREMKVLLSTFGSTFKKADPKAYPIQIVGSNGWTGLQAGSWVLKVENGKPKGYWDANENIIRRTIGMPDFEIRVLGVEIDFAYSLHVKLQKEGYVLRYDVVGGNLGELEPSNTWVKEHLANEKIYATGIKMDKDNIEIYKKAPFPPVLVNLDKVLHIK